MSLQYIKNTLEDYLVANVTTVSIKRDNTTYYTLNGVMLTQAQIDALEFFIEPKLIPITQDRELYSSATPIAYEAYFQIDIYVQNGEGMGGAYNFIAQMDALFREQIISSVTCLKTATLNSFEVGEFTVLPYRVLAQYRNV